ncbi:Coiled-coil domain-containing protein 97 [Sorochytrium milnesiophthora]
MAARKTAARQKNRRLHYLHTHLALSDYFSAGEMQRRNPALYHLYMGKATDSFLTAPQDFRNPLVQDAMRTMDKMNAEDAQAGEFYQEYDSDSESDSDAGPAGREAVVEAESESDERLGELRQLMREHWLDGRDVDFDYSAVDTNVENDDMEALRQDMEDRYFEDEEPTESSSDTGILDY